jgi:hypothetical protein
MGVGGQRHAPAALPPGITRYPLYRRLGRTQGRSGRVLKISPPPGFDPRAVQLVASRYTDYAIPAHLRCIYQVNNLQEELFMWHSAVAVVNSVTTLVVSINSYQLNPWKSCLFARLLSSEQFRKSNPPHLGATGHHPEPAGISWLHLHSLIRRFRKTPTKIY